MTTDLTRAYAAAMARDPDAAPVTPRSSSEDKRVYRVLTLRNGLRAVLISDPVTDKASAALDVQVGHFSDPDALPGLAHFLEHMLFLGTELYPDESSYQAFLSAHGGSSNAYTSTENTCYYFDLTWKFLPEALDRFSAFFKCPLFTPSCVDRELNAVHNENAKNLNADNWRAFQLLKSTSNPAHPMSKFGTGNHATLRDGPKAAGVDVRAALLDFHRRYYAPQVMSLAVVGRESLDELEKLVREKFEPIQPNAAATGVPPPFAADAMTDAQLGRYIRVLPVKDLRYVQLLWFFDQSMMPLWGEKPLELLSHLLGHESAGSVLSYLKSKDWANGLSSGLKTSATSFSLFTVTVDLTEEGLRHSDEVVEAVQSYIVHVLQRSLREEPQRWENEVFREVQAVNAMHFKFKSKEAPISLASSLAHALQTYPPEHVLDGPYELKRYDGELLRRFVDDVLVDSKRARVHLVAQQLKQQVASEGKTFEREQWYQTEYLNEPLPAALAERLAVPAPIAALHLPTPNDFIATDFTIKHAQFSEAEIEAKKDYAPTRIPVADIAVKPAAAVVGDAAAAPSSASPAVNDAGDIPAGFIPLASHPLSSVWWKPDRSFGMPKANLMLRFRTPRAYDSPTSVLLSNLYAALLQEALNEFAYQSQIAGLNYNFYSTQYGMSLSVGGYNQRQGALLSAILSQMRSLRAVDRPADFARLKEATRRGLLNFALDQPYQHCVQDEAQALESVLWTHAEKLAVLDALQPEHLDAHSARLLAAAEIEMLLHGNVEEAEVHATAQQVQRALQFAPLAASQLPRSRIVQLSPKHTYLRQHAALNPEDKNSAALSLFQLGENTVELHAVAELFSHVARQPLYDQLRTKEQLGYLVWSSLLSHKGVLSWRVLLQSSNAPADYLAHRVEAFIEWWCGTELPRLLADPELKFFETNVAAVVAKKLEKDKTLGAESNRLWGEIVAQRFQFDRVEREVAALKALDPQHLIAFADRFIRIRGPAEGESQRAKLCVQYFGAGKALPEPVLRDTEERVAFANLPVASEKKGEDAVAAAAAPASELAPDAEASASPPAVDVSLPPVPVDPREIVMLDDLGAFKLSMPLFPSFQ